MTIKELRLQTKFTQKQFAEMFNVPLSTLKDWEQGRRHPPVYVIKMMKTILELQGLNITEDYVSACERRRASVERMMAILLTSTNGPDEIFMNVLDDYIFGKITLDEMESNVDRLEYLGV